MASRKQSANASYRFRLVRNGVEFEAEGDREFVLDMITQYGHPASGSAPRIQENDIGATRLQPSIGDKGLSVREFLRSFEIKKHTDYVLAFGYYLEKYTGQQDFTPADINKMYYEAKLESSNTSQMVIQNIKRGFVMEKKGSEGGRKRYLLTSSGEKYIEKKLVPVVE